MDGDLTTYAIHVREGRVCLFIPEQQEEEKELELQTQLELDHTAADHGYQQVDVQRQEMDEFEFAVDVDIDIEMCDQIRLRGAGYSGLWFVRQSKSRSTQIEQRDFSVEGIIVRRDEREREADALR